MTTYTDNISEYAYADESSIDNDTGVKRRVRYYDIPSREALEAVKPYVEASTDNKYPGEDDDDIYAHCILRSRCSTFPNRPGHFKVICYYGPPTKAMILQPGRGLPNLQPGSEMKRVWWGRTFISGYSPQSEDPDKTTDTVMRQTIFRKGKESQLFPKPSIIIEAADYASKEREIYNEALDWIGKTGELSYFSITEGDKALFFGGGMRRKPDDVSVLSLRYIFVLDIDDAWDYEVQELYKRFPYEEAPHGEWKAFEGPERGTISRGTETFTRINDYLSWLP